MPNWSYNFLNITGNKENLKAFLKDGLYGYEAVYAGEEARKEPKLLKLEPTMNKIIPVPDAVLKAGYSEAGYDWQVENWGVKWDFSEFEEVRDTETRLEDHPDDELITLAYSYQTAWSINEKWVIAASKLFPKLVFDLSYEEEAGFFAGRVVYQANRELIRRDYTHMVLYKLMEDDYSLEDVVQDRYNNYDEEKFEDILSQVLDDFETAFALDLTTKEKVAGIVEALYNEVNETEDIA